MTEKLGDAAIEPRLRETMNALAKGLDDVLNGEQRPRRTGFVLLIFPFEGFDGRCNYISNGADRRDIITLFKEQIKRFEGQPDVSGRS